MVEESSAFAEIDLNVCDAFILVINAKTGVSGAMIELWNRVSDRQIPRMIIVNGLELSEIDFDDIVLIINRVLENVVTPYLVLHDELGEPSGLISIADGLVHDYSGTEESNYKADDELLNLVKDFREELTLALSEMDESAYREGIVVPALPYVHAECRLTRFAHLRPEPSPFPRSVGLAKPFVAKVGNLIQLAQLS